MLSTPAYLAEGKSVCTQSLNVRLLPSLACLIYQSRNESLQRIDLEDLLRDGMLRIPKDLLGQLHSQLDTLVQLKEN